MSDEFSEDNAAEKFATVRPLPPLRIHHFMLWTAVSALMLTVFKTEANTSEFSASRYGDDVLTTLVYSGCLTGLLLGLFWKREGYPVFDQPGQMAFILHGIDAIYSIFFAAYISYGGTESEASALAGTSLVEILSVLIFGLVQLVLYFRFARKFRYLESWGKFFFAVGILTIIQYTAVLVVPFVFIIFATVNVRPMIFVFLAIPVVLGLIEIFYWSRAVRDDCREGTSYHWTHWLGAATWPAFRVIQASTLVLVWLFMREW